MSSLGIFLPLLGDESAVHELLTTGFEHVVITALGPKRMSEARSALLFALGF